MKRLPEVLFWLGIISAPLAWLLWYVGPEIELLRPVLSGIEDPALRAVLQEAHAERWGTSGVSMGGLGLGEVAGAIMERSHGSSEAHWPLCGSRKRTVEVLFS